MDRARGVYRIKAQAVLASYWDAVVVDDRGAWMARLRTVVRPDGATLGVCGINDDFLVAAPADWQKRRPSFLGEMGAVYDAGLPRLTAEEWDAMQTRGAAPR